MECYECKGLYRRNRRPKEVMSFSSGIVLWKFCFSLLFNFHSFSIVLFVCLFVVVVVVLIFLRIFCLIFLIFKSADM